MIYYTRLAAKCACALLLVLSCSKDNNTRTGGGEPLPADLAGTLLYEWVDEGVLAFDARTGHKSVFLTGDIRRNGFDVSRDGRLRLAAHDIQGNYYETQYTLSNVADGSIVSQFTFYPPNGGSRFNHGKLSPDNKLIVIPPTLDEGIIVLDTEGHAVVHIENINNEPFDLYDEVEWLPGNALLFTHGNYILRSSPPYTEAMLVKEMNYESWGSIHPSHDGQRLAVCIDKHIHVMDIDGGNLKQVTESNAQENKAVFSPNGNYLLVGTDYRRTGAFGAIWELKIIPADGKLYNVDPNEPNSKGVIPIIAMGENRLEASDGDMLWR